MIFLLFIPFFLITIYLTYINQHYEYLDNSPFNYNSFWWIPSLFILSIFFVSLLFNFFTKKSKYVESYYTFLNFLSLSGLFSFLLFREISIMTFITLMFILIANDLITNIKYKIKKIAIFPLFLVINLFTFGLLHDYYEISPNSYFFISFSIFLFLLKDWITICIFAFFQHFFNKLKLSYKKIIITNLIVALFLIVIINLGFIVFEKNSIESIRIHPTYFDL